MEDIFDQIYFVSQKLKETVIKHDEKTKLQMLLQLGIPLKLFLDKKYS